MKRILFILAFVQFVANSTIASPREWPRASYIYCNEQGTVIQRIALTDSTTEVTLTLEGKPGTRLRISPRCYVSDEKDKRYLIRRSENLTLGEYEMVNETGKKTFTLIFPALPSKIHSFDLIEDSFLGALRIYGIHDARESLPLSNLWNGPCKRLPETLASFSLGQATLKGLVVKPYGTYSPLVDMNILSLSDANKNVRALVNSDGKFETKISLDIPMLISLNQAEQAPLYSSYVFLRPEKTSEIHVTDTASTGAVTFYAKNECYARLLQHVPYWLSREDEARLQILPVESRDSVFTIFVRRNQALGNYLSAKYKFTPEEGTLLRTWIEMNEIVTRFLLAIDENNRVNMKDISQTDFAMLPPSIARTYDRSYDFLASLPLDNPNYALVNIGRILPNYLLNIMPVNRFTNRLFLSLDGTSVDPNTNVQFIRRLCLGQDSVFRSICHYDKTPVIVQASIAQTFFWHGNQLSQDERRQVADALSGIITDEMVRRTVDNYIKGNINTDRDVSFKEQSQPKNLDEESKNLVNRLCRGDEGKAIHFVGFLSEEDAVLKRLDNLLIDFKGSKDLGLYFVTPESAMSQEAFEKVKLGVLSDAEHCIRLSDADYYRLLSLSKDSRAFQLTLNRSWRIVPPLSVTDEYSFRKGVRSL